MFSRLMDAMFGCRHARYSFPITVRPGSNRYAKTRHAGTYVACLDCGKEFRYDWQEMKVMRSQAREGTPSLVTKEAA
jgi:RNase P subunit RPR2